MALAKYLDNPCPALETMEQSPGSQVVKAPEQPASQPHYGVLRKGWLLVRITAVAVDRHATRPGRPAGFCGVVLDAGADQQFPNGARLFGLSRWAAPPAQFLQVRGTRTCLAPESIDDDALASVALAGLTACHALRRVARLRAGDALAVGGADTDVGGYAIQIGRQLGALVTAFCSNPSHADRCLALGAHCVRHPRSEPLLGEHEHDVFFDANGRRSLRGVRRLLARDGTYVTVCNDRRNRLDQVCTATSFGRRSRLVAPRWRSEDAQWLANLLQTGRILPQVEALGPVPSEQP